MRIKQLDLRAFGPFTDVLLDFYSESPGLHVILGPNEAGKSSTLRALKAWLFGFGPRTSDDFIHNYSQLRVGGVLETTEGKELACLRRKSNKDSLLDPATGNPISDDALRNVLPGFDEALFFQLHALDHERLVAGGQAILDQSGDLAKSLFGAALGSKSNRDLASELASSADSLFKARGKAQRINRALAELKTARQSQKNSSLSVRAWKELRQSFIEAEEAIGTLDQEIASAARLKSRLERHKRIAGALAERRDLVEKLVPLEDAVVLPEDFGSRRKAALEKLSLSGELLQKAEANLDRMRHEADAINVSQILLDNEDAIAELQRKLGAYQQSVKDKPGQEALYRDHRNAAGMILKGIYPDKDLDTIEAMRPLLSRHSLIEKLSRRSELLHHRLEAADANVREVTADIGQVNAELQGIPQPGVDVSRLKDAVLKARRTGDLNVRLSKAHDTMLRQEEECSRDLSRLGRFSGTLHDLTHLAIPEISLVDRFEMQFRQLEEQLRDGRNRRTDTARELQQKREELKALLQSHEVPSLEELQEARSHRELGWQLVRGTYINGEEPGADLIEYAGSDELPTAYERAVAQADEIGDRLRVDADNVQTRALLERSIQALEDSLSEQEHHMRELEESRTRLDGDWRTEWKELELRIGTPGDMREWMQREEQLVRKAGMLTEARQEAESLEQLHTTHLEELKKELEALELQSGQAAEDLDMLLERCEQLINDSEASSARRNALETSKRQFASQLSRYGDEKQSAETELESWKNEWAAAVEELHLGSQPQPELVLATMEKLQATFSELGVADTARRRVYGMEKAEERFAVEVAQLAERVRFETGGHSASEVALQLARNLEAAKTGAASLQRLQSRIEELQEETLASRQEIELAEQSLAGLRQEAGVRSDEEMVPVEERSSMRRGLKSRLDDVEQNLLQSGDGLSIEELSTEALGLNTDEVENDLSSIESELSDLNSRRDAARDTRKDLQSEIDKMDGSSEAAEAAETAEQLLAGIASDAEQYLQLTIARLILEEQIERYRQQNQTPVLMRASELFARLTLGSFSALRDDVDDKGKPILLGLRPDNSEVGVDGMSEGTRDQLYLALRLATIELQSGQGEAMPFVVDDILVGFDDERSKACLDVLADFAQTTQVLLFTHHEMVAQTATELGEVAGVFVHRLSR
ncbi:MAG: AAA family ATPase [Calditrichaeota bacterium]|nr:AAA family ATPase [Calditrichota bacterium]